MCCIPCASFWFSEFPGILSGVSRPLLALVYLFRGGPLLPFELLATRLFPSSFIFFYTFSSILLPSPASRRLALTLLYFHQFFWVFPLALSLLLVLLLALGTFVLLIFLLFPTLFPGCACWSFAGLASFHLPLPPSHLSFVSCLSLYGSSSFMSAVFLVCRGLSSCCSSMVASFEFFFTYAPRSHSLYPSFVWEFVPGSGAFLFPPSFLPCRGLSGVLYPWLTLMQFMTLLSVVMLSISVGCWLILVNFDSLLFGSCFFYRVF